MPYARQVSGADERMIVFGGSTRAGASDELWELDCSGGNLLTGRRPENDYSVPCIPSLCTHDSR